VRRAQEAQKEREEAEEVDSTRRQLLSQKAQGKEKSARVRGK